MQASQKKFISAKKNCNFYTYYLLSDASPFLVSDNKNAFLSHGLLFLRLFYEFYVWGNTTGVFLLCPRLALKPTGSPVMITVKLLISKILVVRVGWSLWRFKGMDTKGLKIIGSLWTGEPLMDHLFQSGFTMYLGRVKTQWQRLRPRSGNAYSFSFLIFPHSWPVYSSFSRWIGFIFDVETWILMSKYRYWYLHSFIV